MTRGAPRPKPKPKSRPKQGKFTCWSCSHIDRKEHGPTEFSEHRCELNREGYPHIGSKCGAFDYEPGSDEQVWREEQ